MKIKNLKDFRKHVEKAINNALENEVFETVKEIELEHIQSDVLNVYSPETYERRDNLGIDDPENIVGDTTQNGVLKVENATTFNPKVIETTSEGTVERKSQNQGMGLVNLIEYGHEASRYFYEYCLYDNQKNPVAYMKPRPFIANTKKEISETKSHVKAIKSGLERNKIKIK